MPALAIAADRYAEEADALLRIGECVKDPADFAMISERYEEVTDLMEGCERALSKGDAS